MMVQLFHGKLGIYLLAMYVCYRYCTGKLLIDSESQSPVSGFFNWLIVVFSNATRPNYVVLYWQGPSGIDYQQLLRNEPIFSTAWTLFVIFEYLRTSNAVIILCNLKT